MYGDNPSNDPRERFIAQFEWDGADAVYRADRVGPAWRVTVERYHQFIATYDRRRMLLRWALLVSMLLVIGMLLYLDSLSLLPRQYPPTPLIVVLLSAGLSLGLERWLRHASARALRKSPSQAPALSGDERLARTIGVRSWEALFGEIAWYTLLIGAIALVVWSDDMLRWLLVGMCGLPLAVTSVQVLRKWRFERRQRIAGVPALL